MKVIAGAVALCLATSAAAQGTISDPRILSLSANSGTLFVQTAPDILQTFLFAPGVRIAEVKLSDPQAFYVVVSGTADSLTLRAARLGASATMTVRTDMQAYEFVLEGGESASVPRVVRLVPMVGSPYSPERQLGSAIRRGYRISGDRALRPSSIHDDGDKTYIEWAPGQAIPATFGIGPTGNEQMVDGYMREGRYTLDRVYEELIFRIDRNRARATRLPAEKAHG